MTGILGTGLDADENLKRLMAQTDAHMAPSFGQQFRESFTGSGKRRQAASRALEAEEAQKLKMQQSDDARALGTQFALQGGDRNIPGLGYAVAEQLQASPEIRAQGVQNILGDPRINKVAAQERADVNSLKDIQLQTARQNLDNAQQAYRSGEIADAKVRTDTARQLRGDFTDLWRNDYQPIMDAYRQIDNLIDDDNPLAVHAATIKLAKALDPGSVVRESEGRAVAEGGTGLSGRILTAYNRAQGGGWTPELRENFISTVEGLTQPVARDALKLVNAYEGFQTEGNYTKDEIFGGYDQDIEWLHDRAGDVRWEDIVGN